MFWHVDKNILMRNNKMDETYYDTMLAQLDNIPTFDTHSKELLEKLVKPFTESQAKELVTSGGKGGRFVYESRVSEVGGALEKMASHDPLLKKRLQTIVNAEARAGRTIEFLPEDTNMSSTYTRGGHKYVKGKRIY